MLLRERREIPSAPELGEQFLGLRAGRGLRGFGGPVGNRHENVAGMKLFRGRETLGLVQLVVLGDLAVLDFHLRLEVRRAVRHVPQPHARRCPVGLGMAGEVVLEVVVGEGNPGREVSGGDADEGEVHLLVVEAVALRDLPVAHLCAVDDEVPQPLEEDVPPHLRLELTPVALRLEDVLEALAAEVTVLLQLGHAGDRVDHFDLAHRHAEAIRFVAEERVVDQLVERAPPDVERAGQVGRELALQDLLVPSLEEGRRPIEIPTADRLAVDLGDHVDPLAPDRTDSPDDEKGGQEAVEDLDAGRARVLTQKAEHSRA